MRAYFIFEHEHDVKVKHGVVVSLWNRSCSEVKDILTSERNNYSPRIFLEVAPRSVLIGELCGYAASFACAVACVGVAVLALSVPFS